MTPQDRFRYLVQRAKTATSHDESLRAAFHGDSTWTDLAGNGTWLFHHLVNKLGGMFGNVAGTRLASLRANLSQAPYCRVSKNNVQGSGIDPSYGPPGISTSGDIGAGVRKRGEGGVNLTGSYIVDGPPHSFSAFQNIIVDKTLFPTDLQSVEIYCAKRDNCAEELRVGYIPTNNTVNVNEAIVQNLFTLVPGLSESGVTGFELVKVVTEEANEVAGKPIAQYQFWSRPDTNIGTGSVEPPIIACARVLNKSPVGCIIDSFSAGGYRAHSWFGGSSDATQIGNHVNSAETAAQIDHDIWFFGIGLNDFYNGQTNQKTRENLYDPTGTENKGLIGELIEGKLARGKEVPLIILVCPPFRDMDRSGVEPDYAANKALHDAWITELETLRDNLIADGYDALIIDTKSFVANRGFNEATNTLVGTTDRGAYTNGVVYAVDDRYTHDGQTWACEVAHTGSTAAAPGQDYAANVARYHRIGSPHLIDHVHWTNAGSELVADSIVAEFASHFYLDDQASTLASMQVVLSDILADTNDLQTNQGDWATASLAATNATLSDILADTNELQIDLTDGGRLDDIIDSIAAGCPLSGARIVTITVDDGTDPVQDAIVRLTNGLESEAQATNGSGQVVFSVDDGTWTVSITKTGYVFVPVSLLVDSNETATYSLTALAITPSTGDSVTGFFTILAANELPLANVTVKYKMTETPDGKGIVFASDYSTTTSDGSGIVMLGGMQPGAAYQVQIGSHFGSVEVPKNATDPFAIPNILV